MRVSNLWRSFIWYLLYSKKLISASETLYKYGGSGDFDSGGTTWSNGGYASPQWGAGSAVAKNTEINLDVAHDAGTAWTLEKGDHWFLAMHVYTLSGTERVDFSGTIVIEEDWNDQIPYV